MSSINDRIQIVVNEIFNGNVSEFERTSGIKPSTIKNIVGSRQTKPSYDVLESIIRNNVQLSSDWLLTGKGSMLKTPTSSTGTNVSYSGSTEPITTAIGNIGTSIQNGSNIGTSSQDKQVRKDNKDSLLLKAQLEIEFLKREIEILKNQLNQAILDKERAISDKDKAIEDKDKAMNMLVNMLNK